MHTHQSRQNNKLSSAAALQRRAAAEQEALAHSPLETAAGMMGLQGTIGNRGVQRMLASESGGKLPIQAKMTVGPVGDQYEQEADKMAGQVVKQLQAKPAAGAIQRQAGDEEELQMKPAAGAIQREAGDEEELQMKPAAGSGFDVTPSIEQRIQAKSGGGSKMDGGTLSGMESAFGADFGGVSIHNDAESGQISDSIGAQAFTQGKDVFFAGGKYDPGSEGGQELLAHELTHVVQQTGGQTTK